MDCFLVDQLDERLEEMVKVPQAKRWLKSANKNCHSRIRIPPTTSIGPTCKYSVVSVIYSHTSQSNVIQLTHGTSNYWIMHMASHVNSHE